jgi:uncharacterized protein DUF6328
MNGRSRTNETRHQQAEDLHEESRMILPGVQALFGFQLIAIFNQRFFQLDLALQYLHLLALLLVVCAIGLLMTPAALHRIREPTQITATFVTMSSRLVASALIPLAIAIALDVYVVTSMIVSRAWIGAATGLSVLVILFGLWIGYPLSGRSALKRK